MLIPNVREGNFRTGKVPDGSEKLPDGEKYQVVNAAARKDVQYYLTISDLEPLAKALDLEVHQLPGVEKFNFRTAPQVDNSVTHAIDLGKLTEGVDARRAAMAAKAAAKPKPAPEPLFRAKETPGPRRMRHR